MRVRILYHDNCFDGAASAALFTSFFQSCIEQLPSSGSAQRSGAPSFEYVGMSHGPEDVFASGAFQPGAEHACLDFRYSPDPRLTWWFDHHQSAFVTPADEAHFRQAHNPRHFYDPTARSCSKFLADRCAEVFGFDPGPHQELIYWADLIDGAQFESPQAAVELKDPALQLMTWVESNRVPELKIRFIEDLRQRPLKEIAEEPYVQEALRPILEQHHRGLELMTQQAQCAGGVVTYDICDQGLGAVNKFIPYYLFPECHYVVGVSMLPGRAKVSVGSNPWRPKRRTANIAAICSRYGGGGHPVVGAVSLAAHDVERARQVAREIAAELRQAAAGEQQGPG